MSATAQASSRDSLPVCPWIGNPNRLVSLWDLVNYFNCTELHMLFKRLDYLDRMIGERLEEPVQKQGIQVMKEDPRAAVAALVIDLGKFCESSGFMIALETAALAQFHLRKQPNLFELRCEVRHLSEALSMELTRRFFIRIEIDRIPYLDQPERLGAEVISAFPSAAADIEEAGNCLAVERCTASVFHLMRATEIALRCLARDRGLEFAKGSLEAQQWGTILDALYKAIGDLRGSDRKLWPSETVKEAQVRFYNEACIEFRSFNEAWRRHVAHAHEGSFYDRNQAASTMEHVGKFMRLLAKKISETKTTPQYWTSV